jgi:hypothetical protein
MSGSSVIYSRSTLLALGSEASSANIQADLSKALEMVTNQVLSAAKMNKQTATVLLILIDPTTVSSLIEKVNARFPDVTVTQGTVPASNMPANMPPNMPPNMPHSRMPGRLQPNVSLVLTWA